MENSYIISLFNNLYIIFHDMLVFFYVSNKHKENICPNEIIKWHEALPIHFLTMQTQVTHGSVSGMANSTSPSFESSLEQSAKKIML